MVRTASNTVVVGDTVAIPWGVDEIRGTVVQVYGPSGRPQVLIELTPELSGHITDERTTVSFPLDEVRKVAA